MKTITAAALLLAITATAAARADVQCWRNPRPDLPSSGVAISVDTVNVNGATLEQLQLLHRVGPVIAERIIAGRPYLSLDELQAGVKGVGPATIAANRLWLSMTGETTLAVKVPAWDADQDGEAGAWESIDCADRPTTD